MAALLLAPATGKWRFWAVLFAGILVAFVALVTIAIAKGWQFASKAARGIGRVPRFRKWINDKESVIESAEECLLAFHREAPRAFWASLTLNFAVHALASLVAALALEGLTKLINLAGSLNPGNIGTYEGGNMLITKLFGITATSGLTLALCRRARAIFWAAIGAVCLMLMKRASQQNKTDVESNPNAQDGTECESREEAMNPEQQKHSPTVIVLASCEQNPAGFSSSLARVGTLPILLRAILTLHATHAGRIIVAARFGQAKFLRSALRETGRLPESVKFRELGPEMDLSTLVRHEAATSDRLIIVSGDTIYKPHLLDSALEWEGTGPLALASDGELAGIYVLPQSLALDVFGTRRLRHQALAHVHSCLQARGFAVVKDVPADLWHKVTGPEDLPAAERKLDTWLMKPTDGLFARNNRRVSIPISRQLIKLPLTPNMVSLIVLGVSFGSGVSFARGGYWSTLLGAFLSVAASVLDGCDGEVARLKLQSTRFGCWLETVCDYLYYLFVFGGMALGLARSSGNRVYLGWGALLCFGAVMSFLVVSFTRHRFSGAHPENFLAVWQKKAESQSSNPLLFLGRHTEFIIRRCFFPYALFFFALLNLTKVVFVTTALGANLVWVIALYSCVALATRKRSRVSAESASVLSQQATT
jgi:phosphatidylglycerophosphate synthase